MPGHIGRGVAEQVRHRTGNLFRLSKPTQRNPGLGFFLLLLRQLSRHAGSDVAWGDGINGNPVRRDLFGEKALALKQGRLSLAIERGRVIALEKEAPSPPTR